MHIRQRIYASLSATLVAALLTFLCDAPLPAEEQAAPKEAPQHFNAPARQKRAAGAAAAADPQSQAEQTAGSHPGVDIVLP